MLNRAVLYRGIATLWVAVALTLLTFPPVFAVPTQERDPTALAIAASYVAFFERAPDYDGLGFWTNVAQQSGLNDLELMRDLARGFAEHPGFADLYAGMSAGEFVDAIYLNVGGALPDAGGRQFWLNQIQSAELTRPEFVADFVFGLLNLSEPQLDELFAQGEITEAEHAGALLRKNRLTHRAQAGLVFTQTLGTAANLSPTTNALDPASLAQDPVYQAAQRLVSGITQATATRDAVLAYLANQPNIAQINTATLLELFGPSASGSVALTAAATAPATPHAQIPFTHWDSSERDRIYIGTDQQIYRDDLWHETTTRLTQTASGQPGNGPSSHLIVAGDWVIYHTQATNLGEGPGLYRQHLTTGQRELIGRDRWGQPDPHASHPAASADGELIAYQRPDEYGRQHIYLTDTLSVERISLHADATLGLLDHCCVALSHDGHFIVYREQGTQGSTWLHLLDLHTEQFTQLPWPEGLEHAPHFHEDGAELWWLHPEQGSGQPEVQHRVDNPLW